MQTDALDPDLVLLDPELGERSGLERLAAVHERRPELKLLIFTEHADDWRVLETVRTGVGGYLTKHAAPDTIIDAVRVVAGGGSYLDPKVTAAILGHVGQLSDGRRNNTLLTERERAVLEELARGKRNKEISESLSISERTVRFHMSALLQKLHATNRTEVVSKAISLGLVSAR